MFDENIPPQNNKENRLPRRLDRKSLAAAREHANKSKWSKGSGMALRTGALLPSHQISWFKSEGHASDLDLNYFLDSGDRTPSPPLKMYTDEDVLRKYQSISETNIDPSTTRDSGTSAARRSQTSSSSYGSEGFRRTGSHNSSPEPTRQECLDRSTICRYQRGTNRLTDFRSTSSSSNIPSKRQSSHNSSNQEAVEEAAEVATAWEQQLDSLPREIIAPPSRVHSGFSSYRTCQDGRLPQRAPLPQAGAHLSEVTTATDTTGVSLKPVRARRPTETNPLESTSDRSSNASVIRLPARENLPNETIRLGPAPDCAENKHPPKQRSYPKLPLWLRRKPTQYFRRARIAIYVRRKRVIRWVDTHLYHDRTSTFPPQHPLIPPRSSSVPANRAARRRCTKRNAPLFRARSMFAMVSSLDGNASSSTTSVDTLDGMPPITRQRGRKLGHRLSLQALNRKWSRFSMRSTRSWRRRDTPWV